jgi:hypothetical protein
MVLEDITEVRRGNTYEQVERIGEVRKRTDVPLHLHRVLPNQIPYTGTYFNRYFDSNTIRKPRPRSNPFLH